MYHPPCLLFYTHTHIYIYIYQCIIYAPSCTSVVFSAPHLAEELVGHTSWPRSWSAFRCKRWTVPRPQYIEVGKKKTMGITDNERTFYGFPWLSMLF